MSLYLLPNFIAVYLLFYFPPVFVFLFLLLLCKLQDFFVYIYIHYSFNIAIHFATNPYQDSF
ncbi:hypothetical protein DFH27DRAFT_577812, partial [Peziza echinospora]